MPKARLDALGRQNPLGGGPVDVVGGGLVGLGFDGDPYTRYLVHCFGHGPFEAVPHGHVGCAVEVAIAVHPGPGDGHIRAHLLNETEAAHGDLHGMISDCRVGVGEAPELEALVEEMAEGHGHQADARLLLEPPVEVGVLLVDFERVVGLDARDAQLSHPGGHLEPLFQGGFGDEPVVETTSAGGEVPDAHRKLEVEISPQVLPHRLREPGHALAPEVSQLVCHHPSP